MVSVLEYIYSSGRIIVNASQTVRLTNQAETQVGYSDQLVLNGKANSKGT